TLGCVRFSPKGDRIAFLERTLLDDDRGHVAVLEVSTRQVRKLTPDFSTAGGVAWSPDGTEIYYSAVNDSAARQVRAVTVDGRDRLVLAAPARMTVRDVASDGRLLLLSEEG